MLTQSATQAENYSLMTGLPILAAAGTSLAKLASLTLAGHEEALQRGDEVPELAETQADAHVAGRGKNRDEARGGSQLGKDARSKTDCPSREFSVSTQPGRSTA